MQSEICMRILTSSYIVSSNINFSFFISNRLCINYNMYLIYDWILLSLIIFYRHLYELMISSDGDILNLLFYNRMKFVQNSVTSGFFWSRGHKQTMTNNELRLLIRHSKLAQTESGVKVKSVKVLLSAYRSFRYT